MNKSNIKIRPKIPRRNLITTIRFLKSSAIYFKLTPSNDNIKAALLGLNNTDIIEESTLARKAGYCRK